MGYKKYINNLKNRLNDKTIVITGTSSGLGLESFKILAKTNSHIIVGVRNVQKMNEEMAKFSSEISARVSVLKLDLTDISSIDNFASEVAKISSDGIDALINNAGIFARKKEVLPNGFEVHFFTNCLAPIILGKKLLPLLSQKPHSKLVFVSSISICNHKVDTGNMQKVDEQNAIKTYANSKRWMTFYVQNLKKELVGQNVDVEVVHPGISGTSLLHYSHSKLGKFGFGFVKAGMNLLFPSPKKACLSELAALVMKTNCGEWICPSSPTSVYGYPKVKKLKLKPEQPDIQEFCYNALNEIINNL